MRRAPTTLASPFERRLSEKLWKVPTSGSVVQSAHTQPGTGAIGSWTCTTS